MKCRALLCTNDADYDGVWCSAHARYSTLGPPEARAARDEALARVESNAEDDWKDRCHAIVADLAAMRRPFTADDIWDRIEIPHEPRALGAVLGSASRRGEIAKTGEMVKSRRVINHARDIPRWIGCPQRTWGIS